MNGQDQYAPERGVGGFQEFASFPNTCANCWPLRSSTWRPLAGRLGSLLEVPWWALGSQFGRRGALLGVSWELLRASGSTKEGLQIRLGTLLGLVCSLLAAEDGLGSVDVVFYLPSEPLGIDFELPN